MSKFIGINGTARKVTNMYIGVDGIARRVVNAYIGVDGIARRVFKEPTFVQVNPIMTDFDAPTPYVVTQSGQFQQNPGWHVFNGSDTTRWMSPSTFVWASQEGIELGYGSDWTRGNEWVQIDIAEPQVVTDFRYYSSWTTAIAREFTVYGSNDGIEFDELFFITGLSATDWVTQQYELTNSGAYRYYRITVTASNNTVTGIAGIELLRRE